MPNATFLDLGSVDRDDLDLSALHKLPVSWAWHEATGPDQVAERIATAEVVVSNKVVLDQTILQNAPHLKLIAVAATGTNNIDCAAAKTLGIGVSNVRNYSTAAVVQHVFSLILALRTRLLDYRQLVQSGAWAKSDFFCRLDYPIHELAGQKIGIVGYGTLGQAVAQVAKAFGMTVLLANRPGSDPTPGRLSLPDLLEQIDILSLHVPLAENTRGLIGEHELALLKNNALLINTARGGLVDETALAEALSTGKIGGAGIDVLAKEPPDSDNPLLILDLPNLIITPHSAWASLQARQRLIEQLAANIDAFYASVKRNRVV